MKHKVMVFVVILALCAVAIAPYATAGGPMRGPRMSSPFRGVPGLPGLSKGRGFGGGLPGMSRGGFGGGLPGMSRGGFGGGFPGLGLPPMPGFHHDNYSMSKAVRDVGIAHAVVGLVGIMANAAQRSAVSCSSGHWERRAVVYSLSAMTIQMVPELYDSRTGLKIGGVL